MQEASETAQTFRFGDFELNGRTRELLKLGTRTRLQEQPFQVLHTLVSRAGDVVTREELRQKVWPSSVLVDFDHGLNNAIARLREILGDDAGAPRFIETLPRLGYRFVCRVEKPAVGVKPPAVAQWRRYVVAAIGVIVALGLAAGWWLARRPIDDTHGAAALKVPSIAVLPFVNTGDASDPDRFADGLSEELTHRLSAIRGLKVVGTTSAFNFKDKDVPAPAIGEALKADYLLEGRVGRAGQHVTVSARLLDARNDTPLWSETFERDFADIFRIEDDIALAVAAALQVKLQQADELRLDNRSTRDAEAYRLYMMAITLLRGRGVQRDQGRAAELFQAALARDPQFAAAQAGLATYYFRSAWTTLRDVEENIRTGRAAADRAVALDPDSGEALLARANFEAMQSRFRGDFGAYESAQRDYRRASELDPENSAIDFNYGRAVLWDDPDLAMSLFERTLKIDPLWDNALGFSATLLSRRGLHEAARERLRAIAGQSLEPGTFDLHIAALERQLGHLDEALNYLRRVPSVAESIERWSTELSLGDRAAAQKALEAFRDDALSKLLREVATLSMNARYPAAFELLDRHCDEFPLSRVLDVPTARFALIAGHADRARALLLKRLPDLARGIEPVKARNVMPALDLALASARMGDAAAANQLLARIAAFLDGPDVPRWPMFLYLRARTYALAGDRELALRTLDRAYSEGFRMLWALDLSPQPLLYMDPIDADPAFDALRADARYRSWRERIQADNSRMAAR